jgi:pseudouridine synthase
MLERLQKIIARAGIASRRHAEELIRSGQVRVNGVVVTELGAKADPEHDRVEAAGQVAERPAQAGYYLLNKPAHVVSTMSDPEGRATLRHLLRGLSGGVFPVGRLDYAASGLVLLTTDGELADRIFKNSARMPQVYWVKLKGKLSDETLRKVRPEARAKLRLLRAPGSAGPDGANPWYEVELADARRDLLRTSLFALDHPVEKMRRVKFGPLDLGDLEEGRYRSLEPAEVERLRQAIARAEKAPHTTPEKRKKRFRPRRNPNAAAGQMASSGTARVVSPSRTAPGQTLPASQRPASPRQTDRPRQTGPGQPAPGEMLPATRTPGNSSLNRTAPGHHPRRRNAPGQPPPHGKTSPGRGTGNRGGRRGA